MATEDIKRYIGLAGEMHLAMVLHEKEWQVHRAFIDSHTDFILTRYWCNNCTVYSEPEKRPKPKSGFFPTDRCKRCGKLKLRYVLRFIQVKTSEGIETKKSNIKAYSFHAKLRSNIDPRSFYAWIAMIPKNGILVPHYYIFHHKEISKFDDLSLPSYQETDNQKIALRIDDEGNVLNQGRKHNYSCFDEFHNNFDKLNQEMWPEI